MKARNNSTFLGLLALVCGLAAVFFWFAQAFDETSSGYSLIQTAFAIEDHGYPTNWYLVIIFVCMLLGALLSICVPFFKKTGAITMGGISFILLAGSGVALLFAKDLWLLTVQATYPNNVPYTEFGLGTGVIASAVFAFISAFFVLLTTNVARSRD